MTNENNRITTSQWEGQLLIMNGFNYKLNRRFRAAYSKKIKKTNLIKSDDQRIKKISLASGKISLDQYMEQAIYWTPSINVSKLLQNSDL